METASRGSPLRETQRRLRELITAPSREAARPREREAASLLRGDPRRPAGARLDVYAQAWLGRLRGVLAEDFGALARLLGGPAFDALASDYLRAHPPSRPSLRDAGAQLPGFLAGAPAAAELRRRLPFAPDLARLEWALVEAFDAADAAALPSAELAALAPERWVDLGLVFQPALRRLALGYRVDRVRLAHDRGERTLPARLEPDPTCLCVWRRDERVFHRPLEPLEAEALGLALAGASFGRLCETVAARVGEAEAPLRAASLVARWQQEAWLAGASGLDSGPARVC